MRAGHYSHCIRARCPDRYRLAWVGRSPRRAERAHRPAPAPRATAQTGDFNAIPSAGSPARLPMRAGAVLRGRPVDVGAAAGGVYTPLPAQSSAVVFYRAPLLVLVLLAARRLCGTARCAAAGCCGRERSMSPPTDRRTCPERGVYAAAPVSGAPGGARRRTKSLEPATDTDPGAAYTTFTHRSYCCVPTHTVYIRIHGRRIFTK